MILRARITAEVFHSANAQMDWMHERLIFSWVAGQVCQAWFGTNRWVGTSGLMRHRS